MTLLSLVKMKALWRTSQVKYISIQKCGSHLKNRQAMLKDCQFRTKKSKVSKLLLVKVNLSSFYNHLSQWWSTQHQLVNKCNNKKKSSSKQFLRVCLLTWQLAWCALSSLWFKSKGTLEQIWLNWWVMARWLLYQIEILVKLSSCQSLCI